MIRRNVLANVIGGVSTIALNLLVVPVQIRILGAEAYGLIGLIASLQVVFSVLDLGLATTVVREVARDTSPDRRDSRVLAQTVGTAYWITALLLGGTLFAAADWIAQHWLQLELLDPATARLGIQTLALSVALRWPTAFYGGVITGLEALTAHNVLKTVTTTIRLLGGLAVLLIARSLEPFLWWLVGSALLEVGLYAIVCHRLLPGLSLRPGLSGTALKRVWRFSLSMNAIALTTLVFTQADRVVMSRMLPLDQVGYYSLAVTVVMTVSVLQGFVTSALLPAMASDHSHGRTSQLIARYDKATQILIYALAIPVCILVFFGHDLLRAWISLEAADQAARVLALLAAGFLLNASAAIGYTLAVATGHTRLPLVVNLAAAVVYLPALYFAVRALGMTGPAVLWVLLNLYNLITLVPLVHRRVIGGSYGVWLRRNLLPFVLASAGTFSLARGLTTVASGGRHEALLAWSACGAAVVVYSVLGYFALARPLRRELRMMVQQTFARFRLALP